MKCIIPCAGESTRMGQIPKSLLAVDGKPLLSCIVDTWKDSVDGFIFVLKRSATYLWEYLPENSAVIFQDEPRGLADAILRAKPYVDGRFMVALGDCIYRGQFNFPYCLKLGIGVWETNDMGELRKSYEVYLQDGLVVKVEEKPKEATTNLCGMGVYFFDTRLFAYIEGLHLTLKPGGGDLTEVIQVMIDNGEAVSPVFFDGDYINVTAPEDLWKAREQFEGKVEAKR